MQRVRMSLPYLADFHWRALVLAVHPSAVKVITDHALADTLPTDVEIQRVGALPERWTRLVGFSALGLRAFPHLYRAGKRILGSQRVDLVYLSTTAFPTMVLGSIWKQRLGVPFVIDLQDPWVGSYYEQRPRLRRPPKYRLARTLHRLLERWTMPAVDGVVAVSEQYHRELCARYPELRTTRCRTIPIGADERDFELAARVAAPNRFFSSTDGFWHGVYVGVLGPAMVEPCRAICDALRRGLQECPELFSKVRLHFIGTAYARGREARPTIAPIAREMNLSGFITEDTNRVPYFDGLRVLREAHFLLLVGSDNPHYTASKGPGYVLARRALLAVLHRDSATAAMIRGTGAGEVVEFTAGESLSLLVDRLLPVWSALVRRLPFSPRTDWAKFAPWMARELTRRQCELFDEIVNSRATMSRTNAAPRVDA